MTLKIFHVPFGAQYDGHVVQRELTISQMTPFPLPPKFLLTALPRTHAFYERRYSSYRFIREG